MGIGVNSFVKSIFFWWVENFVEAFINPAIPVFKHMNKQIWRWFLLLSSLIFKEHRVFRKIYIYDEINSLRYDS